MRKLEEIKNIYFVPYAHADHAWTNSRQWHIKRYVEGMHRVLDYMKENPDYTYLIDNPLHYYQVLEEFMPERMEELHQRVREGRIWVANGGMSLARPFNYGDELYLRNAIGGQRYFREKLPEADQFMFFNADTGIGHTQMPQLLTKMGHTHYRFYRPEFALDNSGVPREFVWRGLDGSEIVATRGLYGSFLIGDCFDGKYTTWEEKRDAFVAEDLAIKLPHMYTDELFLHVGGDDTFPQHTGRDKYVDITGFMEEWNAHEPSQIRYATPAEYHKALTANPLPVWEGVCDPADLTYNGPGYRSDNALSRLRFAGENLLLYAERLEVLLLQLGGKPQAGLLRELWELMFSYSGHAMQFLLEEDYAELLERIQIVQGRARQYLRKLLLAIAHEAGSSEPDSYLLVNPCLFARRETVTFLVTTPIHVFGLRLLDEDGRELPYQIVDSYTGDKPYVGKDYNELEVAVTLELPALGYRRIRAVRGGESILPKAEREVFSISDYLPGDQPVVLDNGRFRFTVAGGQVTSVQDCRTCHQRLPAGAPFGQLRFYTTSPEVEWTYTWERDKLQVFRAEKMRWTLRGPERWQLAVFGELNGLPAEIWLETERESPTLTYTVRLETRTEEGYFSMAFPCDGQKNIVAGIPYGAEPRDLDGVFYSEDHGIPTSDYLYFERGCKGSYCANRYTHVPAMGGRLLLTQGDASYHYRCNTDDGELETFLLRSMDHESREGLWMRHMHGTQERAGLHRFTFTVSVLESAVEQGQVERLVSRLRFPVRTTPLYETAPKAPAAMTGAVVSLPENLTAAACYPDGDHVVLRLFENSGKGWSGTLPLFHGMTRVRSCDLMEDHPVEMPVENGAVQIKIRPWEIVTLQIC